jgi:hypothetical protein
VKPKHPAGVQKGSMYVRIKHSHPNHVHVTVAKVVREGNSVRHHHVASIGKVKHSGRHPDGRYKFALGAREMLWQWVDDLCASEHFDDARPFSSGTRSPRKSNHRPCRPTGKQWRYNKISACPPMTLGNMRDFGASGAAANKRKKPLGIGRAARCQELPGLTRFRSRQPPN